ncbi:MAG: hypothetical protein NTV14_10025 [Coprothermobacterota bacterium]|nr:hypothetical protein [Coprothermobacterota bacterium]
MPRLARLDLLGPLRYVMVRSIEMRDIFLNDADRERFVLRLSQLLIETAIGCLAWALDGLPGGRLSAGIASLSV